VLPCAAGVGSGSAGQCVAKTQCSVDTESGRCPGQAYCCPTDKVKAVGSATTTTTTTPTTAAKTTSKAGAGASSSSSTTSARATTSAGEGCEFSSTTRGQCASVARCTGEAVQSDACAADLVCCQPGDIADAPVTASATVSTTATQPFPTRSPSTASALACSSLVLLIGALLTVN
jgi:hypothetical protein